MPAVSGSNVFYRHFRNRTFIWYVCSISCFPIQIGKYRRFTGKGDSNALLTFEVADNHPFFIIQSTGKNEIWVLLP